VREDESGDSADGKDELPSVPCVIGGEGEGNHLTRLAKFSGEFIT